MVPNGFNHVIGLGDFPSDWIVKSADELTSKITKGTTPPKIDIVKNSRTPFLRVNNLGFTGVLKASTEMLFVSQEAHEGFLARSIAYPGDILMNIVGPPLGKISMLDNQYDEYNMNQAIVIYRTEPEQIDNVYFLKFLSSELAQQWLQTRSKKTSGQQNLTIQLCKELPVPVPSINEQRKIAKILSTWDKAIGTTEQLIDNSKQQKKALMQQLLSGDHKGKRLLDDSGKPFEGEWDWTTIDAICDVKGGKRLPKGKVLLDSPTPHPYIRVTDMYMGGIKGKEVKYVPIDVAPSIKNYIINKDDLFISVAGTLGLVGEIPDELDGANLTENADKLTNIKCDKKFLLYVIKSRIIQRYIEAESTQNAQPKLALTRIRSFKVPQPVLEEQQKIASVLTNADKETDLLEQQLDDLKQEKKALMQQLLTGKRRVLV